MSWLIIAAFAIVAYEGGARAEPGATHSANHRALPAPARSGGPALATALSARRSRRELGPRELGDVELGQLLWAAQGVSDGHRTAPSAGALYPLSVRVVDARGVWRYVPSDHALVREAEDDRRRRVASASFGQDAVLSAPVVLVITADVSITARKYGARAERYATLEAGHAAQNVLLEATALGLGAVPIGAFDDTMVRRALDLSAAETPLYLIPIGSPATEVRQDR